MRTNKEKSLIEVFTGSPWEIAAVTNLLKSAYINVSVKDNGTKNMYLLVPSENYTAAMRLINNRAVILL